MTFEEAAAIKTLTADEHSALWDQYMTLVPDCSIAPEKRPELEELIKQAPAHIYRLMPHCNAVEFVGYFPWRRTNDTIGLVSISMCRDDNDACMSDEEISDWAYYHSTIVAA
ncbi:hypothetical protein EVC20_012 [Rhizobium phage RHph_Y2_17_1]|nr:hypothetical protein EVC19_012 [Rhizobium phage RHph_Y2_11]QIG75751.1 hypothetical protein EVC20_012 [Rhizobium phage RHph_Y2_17_1]